MVKREITLTLPDDLAQEAEARGLLTPDGLELLIRTAIKRQDTDRFGDMLDRLAALDLPPLSAEEVLAEIDAYHAEQRANRASSF